MEDVKERACGAGAENRTEKVSILVLMEDVKEQIPIKKVVLINDMFQSLF